MQSSRLWVAGAGAWIPSVCWLTTQDTASLLYVTRPVAGGVREVRLVTLAGVPQNLEIDISGIDPWNVTSSAGGETVVVTDWEKSWTVYSRQTAGVYVREQTRGLEGRPWGVCCTHDGGVAILVGKPGCRTLQRYELTDGRLVWKGHAPGSECLTADSAGRLYVADGSSVHVYSPGGDRLTSFHRPGDLGGIWAACPDSSGRRVFVGHSDGTVSLISDREISAPGVIRTEGGWWLVPAVIRTQGGRVDSLALYSDRYMAIGTKRGGLQLYDVEGLLQ